MLEPSRDALKCVTIIANCKGLCPEVVGLRKISLGYAKKFSLSEDFFLLELSDTCVEKSIIPSTHGEALCRNGRFSSPRDRCDLEESRRPSAVAITLL
jgi:hypothetical protein